MLNFVKIKTVWCLCMTTSTLLALLLVYYSIYLNDSSKVRSFRKARSLESKRHYTLAVMVVSAFSNQDRRTAIRATWKNGYSDSELNNATIKFVIGTMQLNTGQKDALERENEAYDDMLLLPDLYDTYDNLTSKVLQFLTWADKNLDYSYILKCDDDSFVQLDPMVAELTQRTSSKGLYWGFFVGYHYPPTSGKWKEKGWFLCDSYLPHALGGGYVLSADVVHKISLLADMILTYHNEDATVGTWTGVLDIERKHDNRFETQCGIGEQCPCDSSFLVKTLHSNAVDTMYQMDARLRSKQPVCEKEEKHVRHCYNWDVVPSLCCIKLCA